MQRINQRQGFLVSAVIHLTLLMILVSADPEIFEPRELEPSELERREVVFLPPPEVLRQLAPPPAAVPRPAPVPTPPPPAPAEDPTKKDRISVGPPTELRRTGPMILRRDDDLTKVRKGEPALPPAGAPVAPARPTPAPETARAETETPETPGREGLRLPPGLMGPPRPQGDEGSRLRKGTLGSAVDEAVDDATRRLSRDARLGLPTGTGQSIEGLRFDPRGADFTLWINDFKNQVYRNWIVPQPALLGYRGHVDFEFTLERDGSMSAIRMLKSSGTSSFDRAARNSLTASRFMALPDDYGPPRVTMQVTFYYNEGPRGS